ncbi:MAG TPA: FtsQ-type POTRA domain-containing protein [Nitrospirota bacterium]|nr:FtsQ-type POTRA domain-containing protein [Nitrospirota bacterium]
MRAKAVKTRRNMARLPKLLVALALIGCAVAAPFAARAAGRYVSSLPFFRVREVRVDGLKYVQKDDFISFIGDPRGGSILRYDMDETLKDAYTHPWIKEAVVRRDFPGTVRFELVERKPAAIAATASGHYLVDDKGFAVSEAAGGGWDFLPVIERPSTHGLRLLDEEDAKRMRKALRLLNVVRSEPGERLTGSVVVVGEDGAPYLKLNGAVVKVGLDGYQEKVKRLSEVMSDIQKRGKKPALIDLRFPGKVVVKEGRPAAAEQVKS